MAETLRELVVALSLDSSNFSRNMRTINQQIKEAESTFRLAGAGVENYEKTIAGTESKLSMLGQKLTQQQRAVEQYSRALVAANDKLKENYDRHQDYTQRLEQAKARQEDLRFEVEAATYAYENYRDSLGETDSATIAAKQNLERYQEEYADATAEVTKLEGQVKALQKTMQNSADAVSKATTDLNNAKAAAKETEAEIRRLTEQLYRMGTLGLICIALNDDSLLEAWTNSSVGICNEEQSRKDRVPWHNTYVRAKGAVSKQYWQNIVQNGRMPFIELLVETAKIYESMNRRGIRQAIDTIQYLAKVPEFQAEELWAYRSDVPGTTTTNGNEESKNE